MSFTQAEPALSCAVFPVASVSRTVRAYRMLLFVLILRPLGNVSLAWGMKHSAPLLATHLRTYLQTGLNPFVGVGVILLILALLVRMAMMSLADLSLVVPLTALGYVFSTALGRFVLNESVSVRQWVGTVLIFLGAALVTSAFSNNAETSSA